jgi:hypothetical protein
MRAIEGSSPDCFWLPFWSPDNHVFLRLGPCVLTNNRSITKLINLSPFTKIKRRDSFLWQEISFWNDGGRSWEYNTNQPCSSFDATSELKELLYFIFLFWAAPLHQQAASTDWAGAPRAHSPIRRSCIASSRSIVPRITSFPMELHFICTRTLESHFDYFMLLRLLALQWACNAISWISICQ